MGGMTKAVESGWAKLKIEASAAEKQARIDSRQGRDRRRQQVPARRRKTPIDIREIDNRAVRDTQIARLQAGPRQARRRRRCERRSHALTACAESGEGNLLDLTDRGRPRAGHGRRGVRRAGEGLGPLPRRPHQVISGVYGAAYDMRPRAGTTLKREIAAFAAGRGPPPARDDRQARPGRPRPRRQGRRHRVRRPRLRRRHRPAVPDARGVRAPGDRERRATPSASRRWPPATRRWCRR